MSNSLYGGNHLATRAPKFFAEQNLEFVNEPLARLLLVVIAVLPGLLQMGLLPGKHLFH